MPPTEAAFLGCGGRACLVRRGLVFNGAGIHNDEARRRSIRKSVSFCQEDVPWTSLALVYHVLLQVQCRSCGLSCYTTAFSIGCLSGHRRGGAAPGRGTACTGLLTEAVLEEVCACGLRGLCSVHGPGMTLQPSLHSITALAGAAS